LAWVTPSVIPRSILATTTLLDRERSELTTGPTRPHAATPTTEHFGGPAPGPQTQSKEF
jgi:hypothetical protein